MGRVIRTIGIVASVAFLLAVYAVPDSLQKLLLDAATLSRTAPSKALKEGVWQTEATPAGKSEPRDDAAGSWQTVAEIAGQAHLVRITSTDLSLAGDQTRLMIGLSQSLTAEVFTLADPYRVVIDMPAVAFALPDGTGQSGRGLVRTFRYGLFSADNGRFVLDTTAPVRITEARLQPAASGVVLEISLQAISAEEFGRGTGADRQSAAAGNMQAGAQTKSESATEARTKPPKNTNAKPVIVIDPGHGGIDPGAVGVDNLLEKDIVLNVSLALKDALQKTGRYEVHLTRARDIFLSLNKRVAISEGYDADLFVSLHADSVSDEKLAQMTRGASVYTLSNRASDALALAKAEKENASDLVAGLSGADGAGQGDVRSILFDLMQRETSNFSTEFSNALVRQLRRDVSVSRGPQRSAAFTVLKQANTPSVLIELGYMSNPDDMGLMQTKAWQTKISRSISAAISQYFRKRQARR